MTTVHTHDNYNNTHKTTTAIHTANQQQLHTRQQYTQDNYNNTHSQSTTITYKTTIHKRQLQQYTRPTNDNHTQDNLKLATIHTRQIRILQHVQKVKTPQ